MELYQPATEYIDCKSCGQKIVYRDGIDECYKCRDKACASRGYLELQEKHAFVMSENKELKLKLEKALHKIEALKISLKIQKLEQQKAELENGE
jgi:ribosomal protein L37AE/L43A